MKRKLLVIDDEKNIRQLLGVILNDAFTVYSVPDALEALAFLENQKVDLILSDIAMPRVTGIDFIDMFKLRDSGKTPVVFLSAKATSKDRILGLNHGALDYITKPFNPYELKIRLKNIINNYH